MSKRLLKQWEIDEELRTLEGWKQEDGAWLVKERKLDSFREAIAFVNKVADVAEELNHHPSIVIDYRKVTLRLVTHDAGGLTELDMQSARAYDKL